MPRVSRSAIKRSKWEDSIADLLDKLGVKYEYEPKPPIKYFSTKKNSFCGDCGSAKVLVARTYTPDFVLDCGIIIEAKGFWKPTDRTIITDVLACNMNLDLRMLFMQDQWLTKKKSNRYSDWCNKKGIKYGVGLKDLKEWIKKS